ncbi:hypothetical protein Lbir_2959 [Legionella birminghamensis]|uniref:Uncharacterized protein n=1 Tax=Legionella birminghamensis TaxID=28083 RepID=A0A378I6U6_9GAMM|nr:hypothetical protein [Legionella birminghamensis]KTC68357.1 hypothetical protein Lbir_2959 [Legionella birminghamensis]STX30928.1 Uncharacterised protein [Legionella birminghamensis]
MAYSITLLGTDTEHTPDKDQYYPRGETLSFISNLVKGEALDSPFDDKVEHLSSKSQILIDGPTTLGTEVGDRIARAMIAALDAISRGEKQINISAHSRGAVEAILVAHELERIQNLFKQTPPPADMVAEIKKSVCPYTRAALETPALSERLNKLSLNNTGEHIADVKVAMFTIDPVPGGRYHGAPVAWVDERFYRVPSIVSHYEQYVYQNERTRCFKAIVPACDSAATVFNLTSLPGHHGTGSGNARDQQFREVPAEKGSTTHVQDLVAFKLLDFLKRNGTEFKSAAEIADSSISAELKELVLPLLALKEEPEKYKIALDEQYLRLYDEILRNREAYRHFDNTGYAVLGQEQGFWALFGLKKNDRMIHYQAHNDTFLNTVVSATVGKNFLNHEHARLFLNNLLELGQGTALADMIDNASSKFSALARHVHLLSDPSALTASLHEDHLAPILKEEQGQQMLSDALKLLIHQVSEAYLNNQFQSPEERGQVFNAVSKAFATFSEAAVSYPLAATILKELQLGLQNTLETKQTMLVEQTANLFRKVDRFQHVDALFRQLEPVLDYSGSGLQEIQAILREMQKDIILAKEQQFSAEKMALLTEKYYLKLETFRTSNALPEEALAYVNQINMLMLETLENQRAERTSVEAKIYESLEIHRSLSEYIRGLDDFKGFDLTLDIERMKKELMERQVLLEKSTAEYIFKEGLPLERVESICGQSNQVFYNSVAHQAIALGAVDPVLAAKEKEVQKLVTDYQGQVLILEKIITEQLSQLAQKDEIIADKEEQIIQRNQHIGQIQEEIERQRHTIENQQQLLDVHEAALAQEEGVNERLLNQYNDVEEARSLLLIEDKLVPITQTYLRHLWKDIQKQTKTNEVMPQDWKQAEAFLSSRDFAAADGKLRDKFELTVHLWKKLSDNHSIPAHSERVTAFYQLLDKHYEPLSKHRDEHWNHFVAKAVAVGFAVVATGILPGLAVLGIMALAKGRAPWQTAGQAFFKAAKKEEVETEPELTDAQEIRNNPLGGAE